MNENHAPELSRISVVIPAYNAEIFIIEALESISRQTFLPTEVIVINDGSSDNTYKTVQEWIAGIQLNYQIHLINQDNHGISATRNVGIRRARGEWIAFLDADDIWEPLHLEQLINGTKLVPSAIAAYGAGRLLDNGILQNGLYEDFWDNPSATFGKKIGSTSYFRIDLTIFPRLIKGNFIKPSSLMISKKVSNEISLFNEELTTAEDREFLARLIRKGEFIYYSLPITQYRWHDDNASQIKNAKRNVENGLRALKLIVENKKLGLTSDEINACRKEAESVTSVFLYVCCQEGFIKYVNGLRLIGQLFGLSSALRAVNFKHTARSFASVCFPMRSKANR